MTKLSLIVLFLLLFLLAMTLKIDVWQNSPGTDDNLFLTSVCSRRSLQTSFFKDRLRAQKDHNSNAILVLRAARCNCGLFVYDAGHLKIDVCKHLFGKIKYSCFIYLQSNFPNYSK